MKISSYRSTRVHVRPGGPGPLHSNSLICSMSFFFFFLHCPLFREGCGGSSSRLSRHTSRSLTYGHESWVMTERMRSQVQASEMRFLRRIEGVTLFNKVRSSEIRKSLNIKPLLLRIERSQLRWFGHVSRMPQERLPKQALHAKPNGRRPVGRPRTRWTDYIEDLGWNRLGLRPSEMMEVQ